MLYTQEMGAFSNSLEFIWLDGKPCPPGIFSIQILLIFMRFEFLPNFIRIFQCYRPQAWLFHFFFSPALSISWIHKVPSIDIDIGWWIYWTIDWCGLILIDINWYWLILIDIDWLILIDIDWFIDFNSV